MPEPWKNWVKIANRNSSNARYNRCATCQKPIVIGDKIFPSDHGTWSHFSCVTDQTGTPRIPICKHGIHCKHPNCFFVHPAARETIPLPQKQSLKSSRNGVFRRWLLDTFGRELLSQGSGLMDVAAGKGFLGFELLNIDNIPAFAFEPRDLALTKPTRRYDLGFYKRRADNSLTTNQLVPGKSIPPNHIRSLFEFSKAEGVWPNSLNSEKHFAEMEKRRQILLQRYDSSESHHEDSFPKDFTPKKKTTTKQEEKERTGKVVETLQTARELVSNCSIVVGMHPDEATEPIIDFAIAQQKPFAVVPCCVHSKQFPNRKITDAFGKPQAVKTYEQFIQYILDKHAGIQQKKLPFQGRSIVLYHQGEYQTQDQRKT